MTVKDPENLDITPPAITSIDQIPQALRTQLEMSHKKQLQKDLADARQQLAALGQLKESVGGFMELLGDRVQLDEGSDLGDVAGQITSTLDGLKTEKERLDLANAKKDELLAAAQNAASKATQDLHDTLVTTDLMSELLGNERATGKKASEWIAKELRQYAEIGDDRTVTYGMETPDENGHVAKRSLKAADAISILEADKDYADFFRSTRNSGSGDNAVDGVKRDGRGKVDLSALANDFGKFNELMEKSPESFNSMYADLD